MKKTIGIVKKDHVEEFEIDFDGIPRILVGQNRNARQNKERKAIAKAYQKAGCDVYWSTEDIWPNDSYVRNNGLYIRSRDFPEIGQSGVYIFGKDFVLASKSIEETLKKELDRNPGVERLFHGHPIHFISPYNNKLYSKKGDSIIPRHLDLSIGHVPASNELFVENYQFQADLETICDVAEKHNLQLTITHYDDPEKYVFFPLNFFVLNTLGPTIIANRQKGFANYLRSMGYKVISPKIPIEECQNKFGSIKCVSNEAESTEVFEHLGIRYIPYSHHQQDKK